MHQEHETSIFAADGCCCDHCQDAQSVSLEFGLTKTLGSLLLTGVGRLGRTTPLVLHELCKQGRPGSFLCCEVESNTVLASL